jgi:hypothetical protein
LVKADDFNGVSGFGIVAHGKVHVVVY